MCRKALRSHFLRHEQRKKRLGWSLSRYILSRWTALRIHNLPFGRKKKWLFSSRWSEVSRCRNAIRSHFLQPEHQIKRLGLSRLSDFLSMWITLRTHNLSCERLKMRVWWFRFNDVSRCRRDIWKHFQHSGHSKKPFGRIRWSDILSRRMALKIIILLPDVLKTNLVNLMMRCFTVSKVLTNPFSANWASKKGTWMNSFKWCFK
jgi:hypothetical protein